MLERRLPWLSIAARGDPAVPLVKMSAASVSSSTSTTGTGAADNSSSNDESAPSTVFSVDTTWATVGTADRSTCAQACAADGSTTTTFAPTACTSRSISGAGLVGLSGTATAPSPSVAKYMSTK